MGTVLTAKSVPTSVGRLSMHYLDFGVIWGDTVSDESIGRPQSVVNVYPKLLGARRRHKREETGSNIKRRGATTNDCNLEWVHGRGAV